MITVTVKVSFSCFQGNRLLVKQIANHATYQSRIGWKNGVKQKQTTQKKNSGQSISSLPFLRSQTLAAKSK